MDTLLEAIDVCDVDGFCFGNYTDEEAGTGCTVIVAPEGAYTGDKVTHDGNIITASGMAQSLPFALELLRTLAGDKAVEKVAEGIQL